VTPLVTILKQPLKSSAVKGLRPHRMEPFTFSWPSAVLRMKLDGTVSTLVHPIALNDCDKDQQDPLPNQGCEAWRWTDKVTVYAAATGCRRLIRIDPEAKTTIVLKSEPPWSPTGVAIHGNEIYVLEYSHANSEKHEDWQPRVGRLRRMEQPRPWRFFQKTGTTERTGNHARRVPCWSRTSLYRSAGVAFGIVVSNPPRPACLGRLLYFHSPLIEPRRFPRALQNGSRDFPRTLGAIVQHGLT
jgi:hypothetical protein